MLNLLRWLFLIREIKSQEGVLHFQRWRLIQTPWFAVYIHRIFKADEDKHCHDHPWSFLSVILSGGYSAYWPLYESAVIACHKSSRTGWLVRNVVTGSIKYYKSTQPHRITRLINGPTTSLIFTGPRHREWGYDVDGEWVHNKEYRLRKREGEWND